MKRSLFLLFLLASFSPLFSQLYDCEYTIQNQQYTGTPGVDQAFEFDIFLRADSLGSFHSRGQVYINYDQSLFGPSVVTSGQTSFSQLALLNGVAFINGTPLGPKYITINFVDNGDRIVLTWLTNFLFSPPGPVAHTEVPTTFTGLYHLKIDIPLGNQSAALTTLDAGVGLNYSFMTGQTFYMVSPGQEDPYLVNQPSCQVDLGPDPAVCPGDTFVLDATFPGARYTWLDGSSDPTLTIDTVGTYWVQIDSAGCLSRDSVDLSFRALPQPNFSTIPGGGFCTNDTIDVKVDQTYRSYQWFNGDTSQQTTVYLPDFYSVAVVDTFGCANVDSVDLRIAETDTQRIDIRAGWNLISTYLCRNEVDLDSSFQDILSAVWIVKDEAGQAYMPGMVNTIGEWQLTKGYWLKAYQDTVLEVIGEKADPTKVELPVPGGWSLISYLRDSALAVAPALGTQTLSNLYALKDQDGNIFLPAFAIDQIGDMEPGQGYWIRMIGTDTLQYPARHGYFAGDFRPLAAARHFQHPSPTGSNANLIFLAENLEQVLNRGDELGIFSEAGHLVGSGVYEGANLSITIWGDDAGDPEQNGLLEGESFQVRGWNAYSGQEFPLEAEALEGSLNFQAHGISLLALKGHSPQNELESPVRIFPNPANQRFQVRFRLGEKQVVAFQLFDGQGRLVKEIHGEKEAGEQQLTINCEDLASGFYTYQLRYGAASAVGKVVVE
jgi:hypothetical protein